MLACSRHGFAQRLLRCRDEGACAQRSPANPLRWMDHLPVIPATAFHPAELFTNEELVESFNSYVWGFNAEHAEEIAAGEREPLMESSVAFIEKASGIKARHVIAKAPVLDSHVMAPRLPERSNDELSILAEIGVAAARDAMTNASRDASDIDAVLCAASKGAAYRPWRRIKTRSGSWLPFDMNVECSSATSHPDRRRLHPQRNAAEGGGDPRSPRSLTGATATVIHLRRCRHRRAGEDARSSSEHGDSRHTAQTVFSKASATFRLLTAPIRKRRKNRAVRPGRPHGLQEVVPLVSALYRRGGAARLNRKRCGGCAARPLQAMNRLIRSRVLGPRRED